MSRYPQCLAIDWNGEESSLSFASDGKLHHVGLKDISGPHVACAWSATQTLCGDRVTSYAKILRILHSQLVESTSHVPTAALLVTPTALTTHELGQLQQAAELVGLRIVDSVTAPIAACAYQLHGDTTPRLVVCCNFASDGLHVSVLRRNADEYVTIYSDVNTNFAAVEKSAVSTLLQELIIEGDRQTITQRRFDELAEQVLSSQTVDGSQANSIHWLGGWPVWARFSKTQQTALMQPYSAQIPRFMASCLKAAGVWSQRIDKYVVFGKVAALLSIGQALRQITGDAPDKLVVTRPGKAVALGAAKLASRHPKSGTLSSSRFSLELSVVDWHDRRKIGRQRIIPEGSSLPFSRVVRVRTGSKTQESIMVHIDKVSRDKKKTRLANLRIGPIQYLRRGYPFDLEVRQDRCGIVKIVATDVPTGRRQEFLVDPLAPLQATDDQRQAFSLTQDQV